MRHRTSSQHFERSLHKAAARCALACSAALLLAACTGKITSRIKKHPAAAALSGDLSLSQLSLTLTPGDTYTLEVLGIDGKDAATSNHITWSADPADVVTIEPLAQKPIAKIKADRLGHAVVTVSYGEKQTKADVTVIASAVTHLKVIAGDLQTAAVGSALAVQPAVQALDAAENPVANAPVTFTFTSPVGDTKDLAATTAVNGLATTAWTLGQAAGPYKLRVKASGPGVVATTVVPVDLTATATAGAPTALALTVPSTTLTAGSCDALEVKAHDAFGNATALSATEAADIAVGASTGHYYAEASCATPLSNATFPAGLGAVTVYYKATNATPSVQLTATRSGLTSAAQTVAVAPGNGSSLSLTGPSALSVSECKPFTLDIRDAWNNPAPLAAQTTITISSGAFLIYDDVVCSSLLSENYLGTNASPVGSVKAALQLAAGVSSRSFYVKTAAVADQQLSVRATGFLTGQKNIAVTAGAPTGLLVTSAKPLTVDSCSGPINVRLLDAFNNNAKAAAPLTVSLTAPNGAFYSDTSCSISAASLSFAAGDAQHQVYFKAPRTGSLALKAAATSLADGLFFANVTGGAAVKLVLSGAASLSSPTCGSYVLSAQDKYGNIVPASFDETFGATAAVTAALGGKGQGSFYTTSACSTTTATTSLAFGVSYTSVFFKDPILEPLLFTAAATGFGTGTLAVNSTIGAGNKLVFAGPTQTNANVCSGALTITSKNSSDVAANVGAATSVALAGKVAATGTATATGAFYSNNTCTTPITTISIASGQNTTASFYYKDTASEQLNLTATNASFTGGVSQFSAGSYSPAKLALTGPATVAAGVCSTAYTVTTQGADGNTVNAATTLGVNLSGAGSGAFYTDPTCTAAVSTISVTSGASTQTFYYKSNVAETLLLAADASGTTPGSASLTVQPTTAVALTLSGPLSLTQGTCSAAYLVTSIGTLGNAATLGGGATVNLSSTGGASFYSDTGCTMAVTSVAITAGTNSATFYYKNSTAGAFTVTASDQAAVLSQTLLYGAVHASLGGVSASNHTCAIVGGGLSCWGYNWSGQLGNGEWQVIRGTPTAVAGLSSGVTQVGTGTDFSCAVVSSGVKCWGSNTSGSLGANTGTPSAVPIDVVGLPGPTTSVSVGSNFACALINDGSVWCWGGNGSGQLGNNSSANSAIPVAVQDLSTTATAVAAGGLHACALLTDGSVQCWGSNTDGQLGDGTTATKSLPVTVSGLGAGSGTTAITAGILHTCAIVNAGAKCWGRNSNGQLGDTTTTARTAPVNVVGFSTNVAAISSGPSAFHTCGIGTDGAVKCWGLNNFGQIGDRSIANRSTATQVDGLAAGATAVSLGPVHTCAIVNGSLKCWGANYYGMLGIRADAGNDSYLTAVKGLTSGVTRIVAGNYHSCAVVSGSVYCWGSNGSGQLGVANTVVANKVSAPLLIGGLGGSASQLAVGNDSNCALVSGGVKCWGGDTFGQLGDASTTSNPTPTTVHGLSSGVTELRGTNIGLFYCALSGVDLKCWGDNRGGQLGDNTTAQHGAPVTVQGLPTGIPPTDFALGYNFACAVVSGDVYCWGGNASGTLGNGTTTDSHTAVRVVGLPAAATHVAAYYGHVCALVNGGVYCWGGNRNGELGTGDVTDDVSATPVAAIPMNSNVTSVVAGLDTTCAQLATGEMKCWGFNSGGAIGPSQQLITTPTTISMFGNTASSFSLGNMYGCAVYGGGAYCWGSDGLGKLGDGKVMLVLTPIDVQF